jgi:2-aminoadipate transaminase
VKAVYLVSYCDNPRGVTLPRERRRMLMETCRADTQGPPLYVIDDQAYRPLQLASDPSPSLWHFDTEPTRTIIAGTFSKSFSPGIRVGWGILPAELVGPVNHLKGNWDFGSPHLNQHLMHRVLQLGLFEAHVERLRTVYRKKLTATLKSLEQSLGSVPGVRWIVPDGGLYVWLELPESVDTGSHSALFERAVARGMLYVPGEHCFAEQGAPRKRNCIRLSFGVPSVEAIQAGVAALGAAIGDVLAE